MSVSLHKIYVIRSRPLHKTIPSEFFLDNDFAGGLYFGNGLNTVSESTVSNTELSECCWASPSSRERTE